MKIQIPVFVALAMLLVSTSAYGQYAQQAPRSQQIGAPQQNWTVPIIQASSAQEPALSVQSNAAPAMQGSCGCEVASCSNRYFTIFGGASTFNDIGFDIYSVDPAGSPSDFSAIVEENNGWTIGGGIGRRLAPRVRGELEWSYRNASLDSASIVQNGNVQGPADLDGQLNVYRQTTNLFFDVNPNGRFNAYFGGGVGVGFVDLDATEPTTPIEARLKTSSFVYQGVVGVSAKVSSRAELFADYRYTGTDHLEISAASPAGTTDLDVDITSNDIFVGIRIWR